MRAGVSEVEITPALGGEIPGQWLRRSAVGVHDQLTVNVLVLESGGRRAAIVSCDVLSLKNRLVASLRQRLSSLLDPRYLLLAATHTHTGPPVCDALGSRSDASCLQAFEAAIERAVGTAVAGLEAARLGWATSQAPGLAFPRRWRLADGSVQMHPRKDDPHLVAPEGVADDTLTVLQVTGASGRPLALCVNFACHPIFFGGEQSYCADYPGVVRGEAKAALGGKAVVLFLNGPCGDVGPDNVADQGESRYGEAAMERMGGQLAARAIELSARAEAADEVTIQAATSSIRAKVRAVPRDDLHTAALWARGRCLDQAPATAREVALRELLLVEAEREREPSLKLEVAGLRIGDGALLALPGEIFAAIGREIRTASPFAHTALVELANGCYGYVPTAPAFAGGGYETWLCRSSRLSPETGAKLVRAGQRVLARLSS